MSTLGSLITLQNLVMIDAVVFIILTFKYLARMADFEADVWIQ